MGLRLADYVVNECGFRRRTWGAEKYIDIVYRSTGVSPSAAVLVTTVQRCATRVKAIWKTGIPNAVQHSEHSSHNSDCNGGGDQLASKKNSDDGPGAPGNAAWRKNGALYVRGTSALRTAVRAPEELARPRGCEHY